VKVRLASRLHKEFCSYVFVEYLRGVGAANDHECSGLFKEYSKCLQVCTFAYLRALSVMLTDHLKGALKERGIDKLLEEAREDNRENDAAYMTRKKCESPSIMLHCGLLTFLESTIYTLPL
jgi:TRIAP1/MDM35 family protein